MPANGRFYVAQFNAKTANFDLEIVTTQVLDTAVWQVAGQIARIVHDCRDSGAVFGKWIGHKTIGRKLWPVKIAPRHPISTDVQLTYCPDGNGLPIFVQDVYLGVGQRTADRDWLTGRVNTAER